MTTQTPPSSPALRWYRAALIPTLILCFFLTLAFPGCAMLDQAAVARTDRIAGAPFYKSYARSEFAPEPALLLPLKTDPRDASRLDTLRAAIDDYLRNQGCCRGANRELPPGAPAVYVGSSEGENAPHEASNMREAHDKYPPMVVHFERPATGWKQAAAALAAENGAQRVVHLQLDLVQYPKADRGLFGKKVQLGTNYETKVRILSAIDKPIEVLQLSGAVLDANGRELCAGGEGIVGSDAPFWLQALEGGRDIDDEALQHVLHHERRQDVPGAPLNWQVAADQLLWNLLHRCS